MTSADPGHSVVLIARRLLRGGLEELGGLELREGGLDVTPEQLHELARGVAAIITDPAVRVDEPLLEAAGPQLRVVANFAVGYDNIDVDACRVRGIAVTNTPDVLTNATAELALALTLAAARRLSEAEAELRAGRWHGWDPAALLGLELSGATFAVIGLGRIGRRYAELVRPMAGEILYVARSPRPDAESDLDAVRAELAEALESADVISLHLPATPDTRHLIGARELATIGEQAVLVNTARGTIVDSEALARALDRGEIGAAGLDVYETEPEVPQALLDASRCVLLPHIGSATTRARDAMARTAARNVVAVLRGEEPPNLVV
jgi:glyoxylate reductase